jgi:hypothetical protein
MQILATSDGGNVNNPDNLTAIFKLWSDIPDDVLRI